VPAQGDPEPDATKTVQDASDDPAKATPDKTTPANTGPSSSSVKGKAAAAAGYDPAPLSDDSTRLLDEAAKSPVSPCSSPSTFPAEQGNADPEI